MEDYLQDLIGRMNDTSDLPMAPGYDSSKSISWAAFREAEKISDTACIPLLTHFILSEEMSAYPPALFRNDQTSRYMTAPLAPEIEQRVRDSFGRQKLMAMYGATITGIGKGYFEISMPPSDITLRPSGIFHGSAIAGVTDIVAGYNATTIPAEDPYFVTVEFKINFLNQAKGDLLIESLAIFRALSNDDLQHKCITPGNAVIPTWKWLRAMVEHEIHHRAQLYLYLNMLSVTTPPIFGITSEEVAAQSKPG